MIKLSWLLETANRKPEGGVDAQIYNLVSDWVISSFADTDNRQDIGDKLKALSIPEEYRKVPSDTLYRAGGVNTTQNYISYSYDPRGAKKIAQWIKKIYKLPAEPDISETPTASVDVLICIPTFLRSTGFTSGRRFDALWKSEYEVIAIKK